ncbi:MAG TPA: acyltransferase [Burkholderiales bacterium]|jgi:maltose O-acetyltransferase|nr:acyltransferase [Burkholderiales bacterium]
MRSLTFRALQKIRSLARAAAVSNLAAVRASGGLEEVLRLLESSDGDDAVAILRAEGARIGSKARILRGMAIHNAETGLANLQIGDDCHVGREVFVDLASPIRIGDRVTLSMRVMVITHTNVGDSRCGLPSHSAGVDIGDDVYIGAGATILPGVRIGKAAVVGAGAVVTRDVEAATTVVGVPAKALMPLGAGTSRSPADSNG